MIKPILNTIKLILNMIKPIKSNSNNDYNNITPVMWAVTKAILPMYQSTRCHTLFTLYLNTHIAAYLLCK